MMLAGVRRAMWVLLLFVLACVGAMRASAQIPECKPGLRVQDTDGRFGTVSRSERNYCYVKYDDTHKEELSMIYLLRPAAAAKPESPSAALPDGEYDCSTSSGYSLSHPGIMVLGRMDIHGWTYRFRPMGKVTQGWAPYAVGPDGSIKWGGKMGGLDSPPSVLTQSKKIPWDAFNVMYKTKPGELIDTMSCHLIKK